MPKNANVTETSSSAVRAVLSLRARFIRPDVPLLPMSRLLQILIAIFLPPLSVFLQRGLGAQFALNIVLTLMFEVPGAIHALWLLLSGSGSGRGGSRR